VKNVIYQIRNVVNGKIYIGSAIDSKIRFEKHRRQLRKNKHHCAHLQASWNKHGEDCFKFEILEQVEGDLLAAEQRWIDQHYGNGKCYNTAKFAGAPMRGRTHSESTLALLKEVSPKGEDHYLYGKQRDSEVKAKISAAQKGKPNKMKGQSLSEEGRKNIAASVKKGEESPFYGKPPTNLEDLKKPILAILPDRSERIFASLSDLRDEVGVAIGTTIRACKSGAPLMFGPAAGWVLSYADGERNEAPEIPEEYLRYPRTRKEAKATGAKFYYTGLPCERSHIAPRKTKGCCVECMREDWKKNNAKRAKQTS
jgi:group I intron endonuclease